MLSVLIAPELALDTEEKTEFGGKSEAGYLAQSIHDVTKHYETKFFDQKTLDWINLMQCVGAVYLTRFVAIRERRRAERARPINPQPPTVSPAEPAQHHKNGGAAQPAYQDNMARATVPGVGDVVFPEGHAFNPKKPN